MGGSGQAEICPLHACHCYTVDIITITAAQMGSTNPQSMAEDTTTVWVTCFHDIRTSYRRMGSLLRPVAATDC